MDTDVRILNAIKFVESHIEEPITIDDIAHECHFSTRSLQRSFTALTGETVMDYLRARRLTKASHRLIDSNHSILDLALTYQFNSYEGFSRAFKKMYQMSPKHFREVGSHLNAFHRHPIDEDILDAKTQMPEEAPTLTYLNSRQFIGYRTLQRYYALTCPENLDVCRYARKKLHSLKECKLPICENFEWSVTYRSKDTLNFHVLDKFYAYECSSPGVLSQEFNSITVPGGYYAELSHNPIYSRNEIIAKAFQWLKRSPYF